MPFDDSSRELMALSHFLAFMHFRIAGAPLAFQQLINTVFADLLGDLVFFFLDDNIIVPEDAESPIQKLQEVPSMLQNSVLKVKLNKCKFMKQEIVF